MRARHRLADVILRRPGLILMIAVALSALAAWGVTETAVITSQEAFISTESDAYRGYQAYGEAFGGDAVVILVPGSPLELATAEALEQFSRLDEALTSDPRVLSVISPLSLLGPAAAQAGIDLSSPAAALELAMQDETLQAQLAQFFSNNHALVVVRLSGGLTSDEQSAAATFVNDTVVASGFGHDAIVAGNPLLIADIRASIFSGLAQSGLIAVVLMVLILFLAFPVRWRLLSLPLVLVGVLWTFGMAAIVKVPLTLITLAGLPILIGLGVDFAIQFHNRYEEEVVQGTRCPDALRASVLHIAPTIGVAVLVMMLGFLTLLMSAVPGVRDFGLLLSMGAVILFVIALFVLNAFLCRFDPGFRTGGRTDEVDAPGNAPSQPGRLGQRDWLRLATILPSVARWSRKHAAWVVAPAMILAALGLVADRGLTIQTDIERLIPTDTPGVIALDQARAIMGSATDLPFLLEAPDALDPVFLEWLAGFQTRALESHPELVSANSLASLLALRPGDPAPSLDQIESHLNALPATMRSSLITEDGRAASLTFSLKSMQMATLSDLMDTLILEADPPAGVTITAGGLTTLTAKTVQAFTTRRGLITLIGILSVLAGLLVIYRDWRRALIAVLPIVLVMGWSSGFMWAAGVDLSPLTAVLGALVIAVGTEFTVLLLSRYHEERAKGVSNEVAIDRAVTKVGRAIAASGLTVAAGFGALVFSKFPALRDFGIVIVVDVLFALVVTVTVVPALVQWLCREPDQGHLSLGRRFRRLLRLGG